jgi:hypothetical protein
MTEFSTTYQPPNEAKTEAVATSNRKRRVMTDALMLALQREIDKGDGKPTKRISMIADKLVEKAAEGDIQAIKEVFDRTEGKAAQAIEHMGEGGGPILTGITVTFVRPDAEPA